MHARDRSIDGGRTVSAGPLAGIASTGTAGAPSVMKWPGWGSAYEQNFTSCNHPPGNVSTFTFFAALGLPTQIFCPSQLGVPFASKKFDTYIWTTNPYGKPRSAASLGTVSIEEAMSTTKSNVRVEDLGDFHDAELTSLTLDRTAGRVLLVFSKDDGTDGQLECKGVLNIKCSTLLFQNVVSRLRAAPIPALPAEEVRQIIAWSFTLDNRMAISTGRLDTHVDNVMSGKLKLLHVDPSWGAEVAILCHSISLHRP